MTFTKQIATAAALAVVTIATSTSAFAVDRSVKMACIGDYFSYCSQHAPSSPGVKSCMRANGSKLSKRCVGALVKAGYVSQAEVSRQAASLGR